MVDGFFTWPRFYRDMVQTFPECSVFIEIGSYKGASLIYLVKEIWKSGKDMNVYAVDHFQGQSEGLLEEFRKNTKEIENDFMLMVMKSQEAAERFGYADFVFIDAAHDYDSVRADIEAWLPKTKGIIAGHDYCEGYPGVMKVVDEIFGDKVIKDYTDENVWMVKLK